VWRELAYTFCAFRDDHESFSSLPAWARETLKRHTADARSALFDQETLARATTGDALWDAAQRSLLVHGELHNNVRMTWGKALLSWTKDPARALDLLIDLNHRYALDGRDPNSYGGILWCLGQFDRPFPPERPILGTVRPRPTDAHASRLDVARYARHTSRPLFPRAGRIAVLGAGVSGLVCARNLADHGLEVTVFEKGRRPGGRLASRDGHDHGGQYFTARDSRFATTVAVWVERGLVREWQGRIVGIEDGRRTLKSRDVIRYVGVPENNSVAAHLASDLDVRREVAVRAIKRRGRDWLLAHGGDEGPFETVLVATPAPQAAALLEAAPGLRSAAASVRMHGCWAVMLTFPTPIDAGFDGAFVSGTLSWVARDGSKPARSGERWVLHASAEWTERHLDSTPEQVIDTLVAAFADAAEVDLPDPVRQEAHCWRFAIPETVVAESCLFDDELGIGACGDWCGGPRIEGAFLSGAAAAGRVLGRLCRRTAAGRTTLF
jgi:predicted NAD/FAD-dependent oxidoreductase